MSETTKEPGSAAGRDERVRGALLSAGVKNLRAFGYPKATRDNILTDDIYRAFFVGMLKDEANVGRSEQIERVRLALIKDATP